MKNEIFENLYKKVINKDAKDVVRVNEIPVKCTKCKGKDIYHWNSYFSYNIFRCGECGREYFVWNKKLGV